MKNSRTKETLSTVYITPSVSHTWLKRQIQGHNAP